MFPNETCLAGLNLGSVDSQRSDGQVGWGLIGACHKDGRLRPPMHTRRSRGRPRRCAGTRPLRCSGRRGRPRQAGPPGGGPQGGGARVAWAECGQMRRVTRYVASLMLSVSRWCIHFPWGAGSCDVILRLQLAAGDGGEHRSVLAPASSKIRSKIKNGSSHKCVHDSAPAGRPRRGKRVRMRSCQLTSGEVVCRSVDGRLRGPRF